MPGFSRASECPLTMQGPPGGSRPGPGWKQGARKREGDWRRMVAMAWGCEALRGGIAPCGMELQNGEQGLRKALCLLCLCRMEGAPVGD